MPVEVEIHPPHRKKVREDLIAFANGFINRWDEFADQETVSTKYNFKFVARQVEY